MDTAFCFHPTESFSRISLLLFQISMPVRNKFIMACRIWNIDPFFHFHLEPVFLFTLVDLQKIAKSFFLIDSAKRKEMTDIRSCPMDRASPGIIQKSTGFPFHHACQVRQDHTVRQIQFHTFVISSPKKRSSSFSSRGKYQAVSAHDRSAHPMTAGRTSLHPLVVRFYHNIWPLRSFPSEISFISILMFPPFSPPH